MEMFLSFLFDNMEDDPARIALKGFFKFDCCSG
jgi:hypothetical protein